MVKRIISRNTVNSRPADSLFSVEQKRDRRTGQVMATMPHQLLKLLLLLLLLAVNLPSCWSLCDISTARRDAQSGSDGYQKVNPKARMPRMIARRAAKGAHVNLQEVEEAYCMVNIAE